MGQRCTVEGAVQSVIFQNEENGYTVLTLIVDGQEEPVTVVGCIPCAAAGEGMTVTGVWVEHPTYGPQLTAESVERRMPQEARDVAAYLGSGILKGVGPATAQRLVDRFGADPRRDSGREPLLQSHGRPPCGVRRALDLRREHVLSSRLCPRSYNLGT